MSWVPLLVTVNSDTRAPLLPSAFTFFLEVVCAWFMFLGGEVLFGAREFALLSDMFGC